MHADTWYMAGEVNQELVGEQKPVVIRQRATVRSG